MTERIGQAILFFSDYGYQSFTLLAVLTLTAAINIWATPTFRRVFEVSVKLLFAMMATTIICAVVWETFVDGYLYDCTDPAFGYLSPDGWIGGGNWPVIVVSHVVSGRSMEEPDEIKEGWSVAGLWVVWFLLFGTSLVSSFLFAWVRWIPPLKFGYNKIPASN